MVETYPLPDREAVRDLLCGLLGREVGVSQASETVWALEGGAVVAAFCGNDGSIGALCACDVSLASHAGAALSVFPAGVAKESVRRALVSESLMENFCEVLNVGAQLFNAAGSPHLAFHAAHVIRDGLPKEVATLLNHPAAKLDLEIGIPGYASGKMTLIVASLS